MQIFQKNKMINIVTLILVAMFFSCVNNVQEVNDFLADKNLPIGESENVNHVYKDSGNIVFRLITPLLLDFLNRKKHPYSEFPKGIKIVVKDKLAKNSTTITGDYAVTYGKTSVAEIVGNVVVFNHTKKMKLETPQLYWDQDKNYFFTENKFKLTTQNDTLSGTGFESTGELDNWVLKSITGDVKLNE